MAKKLFLIDGHSHCYKAFYAIPRLTSPDGRPTNAVYGFTVVLLKILREEQPDYLAVVFDAPGPTVRHVEYAAYKAQRKPMPDELRPQIPLVKQVVEAANTPILSVAGVEADDVIGTLAKRASAEGIDVYIATADKDALQLLDEHIRVYNTTTGMAYGPEELMRDKGIRPDQVVDMMALTGDTSDNVPGIRGIGPKTAIELIQQYETLGNLLDHAEEVKKPSIRNKLVGGAEIAEISRKLVTLDTDVPLDIKIEDCAVRPLEKEKLGPIFAEFGFRKLLADLGVSETGEEKPAEAPPTTRGDVQYHTVDTESEVEKLASLIRREKQVCIDLETTDRDAMRARIVGLSFACKEREAYYIPVAGPVGSRVLPLRTVLKHFGPIYESESIRKIGQNIKYDYIVLRNAGVRLRGICFDTMVAAYLLDPERRRYNLDDLTFGYLGFRKIPTEDLIGSGRQQTTMDLVDVAKAAEYSCEDADTTWRLFEKLSPELEKLGLADLARDLEFPLIEVLAEMEFAGITVDAAALADVSEQLARRIDELAAEVHAESGEEFNIDSPKQLSAVLFEKMKMPHARRTKTGFSTDADVLAGLAYRYPLVAKVSKYRGLKKIKGTYSDALPKMINKATGRVHTSFNQTMTATGRLSSSDPNLQNIPVRSDEGREIRRAFVASGPDRVLLSADYSQIELRIMAHVSGDPALRDAFLNDLDIHNFVAAEVNGVGIDDVTPAMRRQAKVVNFGIIYGLTPYGLSKDIGVDVEEAKEFIDAYFSRYSRVKTFIDETIGLARSQGFVTTMFGRRRYLPTINSRNDVERKFAERTAVNAVIQGSAADAAKIAMNNIYRRIEKEKRPSQMLLQIHDELLFEMPKVDAASEREMIEYEMCNAVMLDVPIQVNIGIGPNWLDME